MPNEREAPSGLEQPDQTRRGRISYNATSRFVGRVIGAVISVVALRLATRYFGPGSWGVIVAATALSGIFVGVCDFGIATIASRDLAAAGEERSAVYAATMLAIAFVSVPLMAVMLGVDLGVYEGHHTIRDLGLILVPLIPLNGLWLGGGAVLIAKARNDLRGLIDVATSILLLAAVALVVAAHLSAAWYMLLTLAWTAAGAALAVGFAHKYVRADLQRAREYFRGTLKRSAPLGAGQVLNSFTSQIDTVLLTLFSSTAIVGAFGLAAQVAVFGISVPPMLTAAILPKFMASDDAHRQATLQRSFDVLAVLGAPLPLFAILFGKGAVLLVGGARFGAAVTPLILLSFFAALAFPAQLMIDGLVYVGAERRRLRLSIMVAVVNLATAAVAIPIAHAVGAAIAMIVSVLTWLVAGLITFRRTAGYGVNGWKAAKASAAAGALLAVYLFLHTAVGLTMHTGLLIAPEALAVAVLYGATVALWGRWRRTRGQSPLVSPAGQRKYRPDRGGRAP